MPVLGRVREAPHSVHTGCKEHREQRAPFRLCLGGNEMSGSVADRGDVPWQCMHQISTPSGS